LFFAVQFYFILYILFYFFVCLLQTNKEIKEINFLYRKEQGIFQQTNKEIKENIFLYRKDQGKKMFCTAMNNDR